MELTTSRLAGRIAPRKTRHANCPTWIAARRWGHIDPPTQMCAALAHRGDHNIHCTTLVAPHR
eukprot:5920922-Pyramimonas_sp.AAC.1